MTKRALISVTDKQGVVELARGLVELGYEILSTGGTCRVLEEAGVPVTRVSDYTGFPEILDGRVKTLHPRVHGGILARRDEAADRAAMAEHGIAPIDVVVVNLYRFRDVAADPEADWRKVVEQIDVGGPAMIRSAAKNHAHVAVLVDPADYPRVLETMRTHDGDLPEALRRDLAAKAFAHTAAYDGAVAAWFARGEARTTVLVGEDGEALRYGENPHQRAVFYRLQGARGPSLARARRLGGKELSYNNLLDLDAALGVVAEHETPAATVVKHGNPCGAATAPTIPGALTAAFAGDPVSAFGGIVALNGVLDAEAAATLVERGVFVEAVVAPEVDERALEVLAGARWGRNVRVLALGGWPPAQEDRVVRQVSGGLLSQTPDAPRPEPPPMRVVTRRAPGDRDRTLLAFAWKVCKHVKSNAIVLAREVEGATATVGVGAGQTSRVDAVRLALEKAGDRARGAVLASDAFFPFPDGVVAAAEGGVVAIVQPGGSRRDEEVIAAADAAGIAMALTGERHFRH